MSDNLVTGMVWGDWYRFAVLIKYGTAGPMVVRSPVWTEATCLDQVAALQLLGPHFGKQNSQENDKWTAIWKEMDESCGPRMSLLQSDERNKYFPTLIAVLTTTWKVITDNDLGQTDVFKVTVLQEQSANRPEESLLEKSTKIGGRIWGHSLLLFSYSLLGISKNNDSLKNRIWGQKDKRQGTLKSFSFFCENIKKITSQHFLWDWFFARMKYCKNYI